VHGVLLEMLQAAEAKVTAARAATLEPEDEPEMTWR
jgi:hypothetical protein